MKRTENDPIYLRRELVLLLVLILTSTPSISFGKNKPAEKKVNNESKETSFSVKDFDLLPDGSVFPFWEDKTDYKKIYHVAQINPAASDNNPGTQKRPFKTINAAAKVLKPGEKVIVHEGVYREFVSPVSGGTSQENMITYEASKGERVIVKGSEIWKPQLKPSSGWNMRRNYNSNIQMADIPEDFFKAYNPFSIRNAYQYLTVYGQPNDPEWMTRAMLFRGMVFLNGKPLKQVYKINELAKVDSAFWVEDPGLRLHLRLPSGMNLSRDTLEITTREQLFAPRQYGLGYIRIKGFIFEHSADGLPVPQRAAVSTMRGHHWIIENNVINQAHACALDIGLQSWDSEKQQISGYHIVRNNIIRNAGICGIAGAVNADWSLIENNVIENIGSLDLERMYECAAIKFHVSKNLLIRQNIIRDIKHAAGIWLDCDHINCRVTNNVFSNIQTLTSSLYMEMNFDQNLIDHNIFWDIRNDVTPKEWLPPYVHGAAIRADCNDKLIIAHNFFGKVNLYAICINMVQSTRKQNGRTGLCFNNKVVNNVFYRCPNRIYLAHIKKNIIDSNLYDKDDEEYSFLLLYPSPASIQNLKGWQDFFGLDKNSREATMKADFNSSTNHLEISLKADIPHPLMIRDVMNGKITTANLGPFTDKPKQNNIQITEMEQTFPVQMK